MSVHKPYADKTVMRPLGEGDRCRFAVDPFYRGPSGARRKNHAQGDIVIRDSEGLLWPARCLHNPGLYEVQAWANQIFIIEPT